MCDLFHGTDQRYLQDIAEMGLLPCELNPNGPLHHKWTKHGVVYAVDVEEQAETWGRWVYWQRGLGSNPKVTGVTVLCLDAEPARFDRNLHNSDGTAVGSNHYPTTVTAYEIDGPVPPERIRVHWTVLGGEKRCTPIREYVKEAA